jgi:RNA polymerase sigma factor (sigma-70 family)
MGSVEGPQRGEWNIMASRNGPATRAKENRKRNPQLQAECRKTTTRTPLSDEAKAEVARKFHRGVPAEGLAEQYCRSDREIKRIVKEERARKLLDQPIEYMASAEFKKRNAEGIILAPPPESTGKKGRLRAPAGLPPYLASLYEVPLLSGEQEAYYFRKMNYLKYRAAKLQRDLDPGRPDARTMDEIERLLAEANEVRNLLIRRNLRLVVSIAKKYVKAGTNFFEMVSDGNVSLMRAIDKFDYTRGFKLSTYATWAIRKNFARSIPAEYTQLSRFRTGGDEWFQSSRDNRANPYEQERTNETQHTMLQSILKELPDRDREIIAVRYGLERGTEPQTLEAVGQQFGVSKERIRQLEARALRRMRDFAEEQKLDIPGV